MRRRVAAFTTVKDEGVRLPKWLSYYRQHIDHDDIYVLDQESEDLNCVRAAKTVNQVVLHHDWTNDVDWQLHNVKHFHNLLLGSYNLVVYADVDEFLVPDPSRYPGGLREYLERCYADHTRAQGYNVLHLKDEPPLDWNSPVLVRQRGTWMPSRTYCKQLINGRTPDWTPGFHLDLNRIDREVDPDLYLVHLQRVDFDFINARYAWAKATRSRPHAEKSRLFEQCRMDNPYQLRDWCAGMFDLTEVVYKEPIPGRLEGVL